MQDNVYTDKELRQLVANALNVYCFKHIWNETKSEFRINIIPDPISERPSSGNVFINGKPLPLPTGDSYYVYAITSAHTHGINNKTIPHRWISLVELCNDFDILVHAYHISGKMFSKGFTYIYPLDDGTGYILAINKTMATKVISHYKEKTNVENMIDVRITIYYDSDNDTNHITVYSTYLPKLNSSYISYSNSNEYNRNYIATVLNKCTDNKKLSIYANGFELVRGVNDLYPEDSYIDIIYDDNVIFTYDIDLTDSKMNNVYYSEKDKTYKYLIHFPKSLNPNNEIFSHNTMMIFVRSKNKNAKDNRGVYLHRCAPRNVTQVTHNDIGIPVFIVDAFRDYLNNQNVTIHIQVRRHDKDNVLVRDKSYIDLMYTETDTKIIKHLLGQISSSLDFWRAENLEYSQYVRMMFDVANTITEENIYDYVEGLGYYQTICLICQKTFHKYIHEWNSNTVYIEKPYMYQQFNILPIVYINGQKILQKYIKSSNADPNVVGITIDPRVEVNIGDRLSVEMYLNGPTTSFLFTPEEEYRTIDIPYRNYTIIEKVRSPVTVNALGTDYKFYYKKLDTTSGNGNVIDIPSDIENYTQVEFSSNLDGRVFIIQNNVRVHYKLLNIDPYLQRGDPILIDILDNTLSPIWYIPKMNVYLNGKYLVKDIDFSIIDIYDDDERLLGKKLCIQNFEYLQTSGNQLEYYITSAEIENQVNGFETNNRAWENDKLALLYDQLSVVHVNGLIEPDAINKGKYIELPKNKYRQGSIFEVMTYIPKFVKDFINEYHVNDDIERIEILNDYFYNNRPSIPDPMILTQSYKIYSVYTAPIIRDLVNKDIQLALDPDLTKFESEQLIPYKRYKDIDLVVNDKYDLQFVDTYPHYKQFEVDDITNYTIANSMLVKLLPDDQNTTKEVVQDTSNLSD